MVVFLLGVFSTWPWEYAANPRCQALVWRGAGFPPAFYGRGHYFSDGIKDTCELMHRLAWDAAAVSLVLAGACFLVLWRGQIRRLRETRRGTLTDR